jgi:hypothetical protein
LIFWSEQSNIQIVKNIKTRKGLLFIVVAVHNDVKQVNFLTKMVAAGRKMLISSNGV